jgi:glyoxylase-like metal-dependent hydrolase (beta-lactamase superfamily II)
VGHVICSSRRSGWKYLTEMSPWDSPRGSDAVGPVAVFELIFSQSLSGRSQREPRLHDLQGSQWLMERAFSYAYVAGGFMRLAAMSFSFMMKKKPHRDRMMQHHDQASYCMVIFKTPNTQPEPYAWSAVPGTQDVQIYPIIRKPSVLCSNTYIIRSPGLFIVIDPGTDLEQIEHTRRVIMSQQGERLIPVFLFLTHCHIDHFLAVHLLMDQTFDGQIICHPITADAIENMDENVTLANMNGSVLPVCRVRDRFFQSGDQTINPEERPLSIESGMIELEDGHILQSHVIPLGEKDRMEVFHTPGHSPDSTCYQVGQFICTGDLHLATTPGIAGKYGWDNHKLAASLKYVAEIGERKGTTHVFPGHGNSMSFDKAKRIFLDGSKDALQLTGLALFNRERSMYLSEYAVVLLEEASSLFSIIAARLLKISYYLEAIGENESAESVLSAIDSDTLDSMVEEFHDFIVELKGKRGAPVISKAVQFSRKVNKIFEPEKISGLFDPHFLRRIKNLLSDFVNVVYGARFAEQETTFDLNDTVEETLALLQKDLRDSHKIYEVLDDNQEFVNEFARRIAYTPLFSSTRFSFSRAGENPHVTADRLMFQDMLTALLEQLAIAEINHISLETGCDGERATLSVTLGQGSKPFTLRESKMLYFQHSMKIAGGEFHRLISGEAEIYRFLFSRASKRDLRITPEPRPWAI